MEVNQSANELLLLLERNDPEFLRQVLTYAVHLEKSLHKREKNKQ